MRFKDLDIFIHWKAWPHDSAKQLFIILTLNEIALWKLEWKKWLCIKNSIKELAHWRQIIDFLISEKW